MKHTGVICIFLAFVVGPKASSLANTNWLTCVTDYWNTISCSLKLPVTPSGNTSYRLEIYEHYYNQMYECQLQTNHEEQNIQFTVQESFKNVDCYIMTLHSLENGKHNSSILDNSFIPHKNIKPKTPFNLTVQNINETYEFFWTSGYENHIYRKRLPIRYQLVFYRDGVHKNVTIHSDGITNVTNVRKLHPNAGYTAIVRSEINDIKYKGTWSEWSRPVSWTTPYRDEPGAFGKIIIVMFLFLGLLIVLISIGAARFKIKELAWIPTPKTYFEPLYQNYQGNFQGWVMAKSPLQDIHVLEDFATIDKISEVTTTLQEQPEVIYSPPQGHPPYVGPTTELWAPCHMIEVCSEKSVSCEDFPLFCDELPDKVDGLMQSVSVACLSEDVASLKDSAVSLESLEDCGSCEEQVIITNPMPLCFKQDYCTLTDTPTGLMPTFSRDGNISGS